MRAEVDIHSEFEIGLMYPNGDVIYPPETFHGHSFDNVEGRANIFAALQVSENNLGYPQGKVVGDYRWVRREKQIIIISRELETEMLDLDAPELVAINEDQNDEG